MFEQIENAIKILNLAGGVFVIAFAGMGGVVAICKLAKWSPINLTVIYQPRDPEDA